MAKTIAFFGASTGVGLSALKHSLAAGHQCVALCRTPAKLAAAFPAGAPPNLRVVEGNAHDEDAVARCLAAAADGRLVDAVVTTIGAAMRGFAFDDPHVCRKGMATLLAALGRLRRAGGPGAAGRPLIVACSTTGTSRRGRDYPLYLAPVYTLVIRAVVADKVAMEDALAASGERFAVVRPSLLTNGATATPVRVGIEDPRTGREVTAIGRAISREDTGKWVADNLLLQFNERYADKMITLTW